MRRPPNLFFVFRRGFFRRCENKRPSHFRPPSHSCEGRNLHAEGANCKGVQLPAALRRRRFRLSPEWKRDSGFRRNGGFFLFLRTIPNLAVSENIKIHHSGESRNLIRRKANPPFALARKEIPAFVGMEFFLLRACCVLYGLRRRGGGFARADFAQTAEMRIQGGGGVA